MAAELPSTMRASQWSSAAGGLAKNLKFNAQASLPKNANSLPAEHTLVRVSYASLNPVDYKIVEAPLIGSLLFSKPAIPGCDYSGKVVSTTLPHLKSGEEVFGMTNIPMFGTLGEYIVVGKEGTVPVPSGVPLDQAACIGITGITAYQSIVPHIKPGGKIFINAGSGGTGTFGIQIAKAIGCEVTTTCSGPNVELCKSLGADNVIDYRTSNVIDTLKRSGTQYDLIVDNQFGTPDIYWNSHYYLKPDGKFITIAGSPSLQSLWDLLRVFLLPTWLGGGQRKFQFVTATAKAEDYVQIAKLMQEGKVKAVIEKTYSLEEAPQGYERLHSGRTRGKLVVKVTNN